jgi:hypothetical protein
MATNRTLLVLVVAIAARAHAHTTMRMPHAPLLRSPTIPHALSPSHWGRGGPLACMANCGSSSSSSSSRAAGQHAQATASASTEVAPKVSGTDRLSTLWRRRRLASETTPWLSMCMLPPMLLDSKLIAAAVGGTFAGGLHAVTGPDHLAALLPQCMGRRWWTAMCATRNARHSVATPSH